MARRGIEEQIEKVKARQVTGFRRKTKQFKRSRSFEIIDRPTVQQRPQARDEVTVQIGQRGLRLRFDKIVHPVPQRTHSRPRVTVVPIFFLKVGLAPGALQRRAKRPAQLLAQSGRNLPQLHFRRDNGSLLGMNQRPP